MHSHDAEHSVFQLDGVKALLPLGHRGVDVHAETHHTHALTRVPYGRVDERRRGSNSPAVLSPQPDGWQNAVHLLSLFSHQVLPLCAHAILWRLTLPARRKQEVAWELRLQRLQLGDNLTRCPQTRPRKVRGHCFGGSCTTLTLSCAGYTRIRHTVVLCLRSSLRYGFCSNVFLFSQLLPSGGATANQRIVSWLANLTWYISVRGGMWL